eukprot:14760978-Alexandrium_andersonii.AAC.1
MCIRDSPRGVLMLAAQMTACPTRAGSSRQNTARARCPNTAATRSAEASTAPIPGAPVGPSGGF